MWGGIVKSLDKALNICDDLWNYPGINDRITKLENEAKMANTHSKISDIIRALNYQDEIITKYMDEIDRGVEKGDKKTLMSYRRRVRMLKQNLLKKKIV